MAAKSEAKGLLLTFRAGSEVVACAACLTQLCLQDGLISKAFRGKLGGKAWLVHAAVINIKLMPQEDRMLMTGLHTIAECHCANCDQYVGWHYLTAFEETQKFKEGKFILERPLIALKPA